MRTTLISSSILIGLALSGCQVDPFAQNPGVLADGIGLRQMESCDQAHDALVEQVLEALVQGQAGWYGDVVMEDDMAMDEGAPEAGGDGGSDAPSDYSGTNNQEQGVDEMDTVKTNGTHVFTAIGNKVRILDSWPVEEAEVIAEVDYYGHPHSLFLSGDTLVVVGSFWAETETYEDPFFDGSRVHLYDVSDPSSPTLTESFDFSGYVVDGRNIGDQLFLVVQDHMWNSTALRTFYADSEAQQEVWDAIEQIEEFRPDWDASESEQVAWRAMVRGALRPIVEDHLADLDAEDTLPQVRSSDGAQVALSDCTDVYTPAQLTGTGSLSVVRISDDGAELQGSTVLSDGWQVYASEDNLYVASARWWWWNMDADPSSYIHMFGLPSDDVPAYKGSGEVSGYLYDQFAMSEHDGHLRVVSTDFRDWREEENTAANHVNVLKPNEEEGGLDLVGHVGDIAPGEQIMAARLMGDKGYIITFEQTDPLFTLDLSDPTAPSVEGELHMPGFSGYLHPIDGEHLLGIGMAGTEEGVLTGLAINVFDVSDMSDPILVTQYDMSPEDDDWAWSWSPALGDHHAIAFHGGLLSLPIRVESWNDETGEPEGFNGVKVFSIDDESIAFLGDITHEAIVEGSACDAGSSDYNPWLQWEERKYDEEGEPVDPDQGESSEGSAGSDGGETDPAVEVPDTDDVIDEAGEIVEGEDAEEPPADDAPEGGYYEEYLDDCGRHYLWQSGPERSVFIEGSLLTFSRFGVSVNTADDPADELHTVIYEPMPEEEAGDTGAP